LNGRRTERERKARRPDGVDEAAQVGDGKFGLFSLPGADGDFKGREIEEEERSLNGEVHGEPRGAKWLDEAVQA
jgi:hypothetical protein